MISYSLSLIPMSVSTYIFLTPCSLSLIPMLVSTYIFMISCSLSLIPIPVSTYIFTTSFSLSFIPMSVVSTYIIYSWHFVHSVSFPCLSFSLIPICDYYILGCEGPGPGDYTYPPKVFQKGPSVCYYTINIIHSYMYITVHTYIHKHTYIHAYTL